MSRKYNRSQHVHKTAVEILKMSMKPRPHWMPKFVWAQIIGLVFHK